MSTRTHSVNKRFLQMDGNWLLHPVGLLEVEVLGGVGIPEGHLKHNGKCPSTDLAILQSCYLVFCPPQLGAVVEVVGQRRDLRLRRV